MLLIGYLLVTLLAVPCCAPTMVAVTSDLTAVHIQVLH